MKNLDFELLRKKLLRKNQGTPLSLQLDLTYRCNLKCVHCYCQGSEDKGQELNTREWKRILDEIRKEGCLWLTLSGGDPLVRDDFLELYVYAKSKGFIITLLTNALGFTDEIIEYLIKSPVFAVSITLNGITPETYESITGIPGAFAKVKANIEKLVIRKIPLEFKINCLKENKHEIAEIKKYVRNLKGGPKRERYHCAYSYFLDPRINGDITPTRHRVSWEEATIIESQFKNIPFQKMPDLACMSGNHKKLYRCGAEEKSFSIDPFGRLKFCTLTDKFSVDLRKTSFREGFRYMSSFVPNQSFRTKSKCQDCSSRADCPHCPVRAYLETGDEEAPIEHYCEWAKKEAEYNARLVR